jgi:preprotein translocase subunit SecA
MLEGLKKMFQKRSLASLEEKVKEINALEPAMAALSDGELTEKSLALRERVKAGQLPEILDEVAVEAFALVREAAKRTLNQRPFDVQLLGGLVLHSGAVAEMMTGEGKTLAGVAPAYLNALAGEGVHVVTVNEYLSRRDAVWMGKIYRLLGLTVGSISLALRSSMIPSWRFRKADEAAEEKKVETTGSFLVQQEFLRPVSRQEAYRADITYGTNHEFGFDYLRDNLVYRIEDRVQHGHNFAIIDEVDSILIDEARTPLIIAAPDAQSSDFYKAFARIAANLEKDDGL